jgi:hypothetical protein
MTTRRSLHAMPALRRSRTIDQEEITWHSIRPPERAAAGSPVLA